MKKETQIKRIREWLESGKKLTSLQAFYEFRTLRLSGHIYALKKQGLEIETKYVEIDGRHIAEYQIVE